LNRPDVHNAFNEALIAELTECFTSIATKPEVRAVVLFGHGKSFCAGADLKWMQRAAAYTEAENIEDARVFSRMLDAIDTCPPPVIGRIHGVALGGAMGLVSCCDIAIAAEGTRFGITEVRLGIIPAVISPYLVRKIGISQARSLALTGEFFDARRAQAAGAIHEVVPAERLDAAVAEKVEAIRQCGPEAVTHCKKILHFVGNVSFEEGKEAMPRELALRRRSQEAQQRMAAFFAKRERKRKK
ncbi:MAG: hypothetical protein D6812_09185, partial [Deltaproteobacteria bacterium]